eukprot:m.97126 g.97126  ORF g.97126 m.97126 type:complete len:667 (+) comp20505_c0_seq1:61-2061(+)
MSGKGKKNKNKAVLRSPAEFFADNKSIAGFDNPGKSTFTAIREFVENSLDATEEGSILPNIQIQVDGIDKTVARPPLYGKASPGTANAGAGPAAATQSKTEPSYFRITVRDNGIGMPHDEVPNMLARVLSGSKYGIQQSRGRFGLGAKMALIWSKMTTAGELVAYTSQKGKKDITFCRLDIDLNKNEPKVKLHEKLPNDGTVVSEMLHKSFPEDWHGAEVSVMFEGNWTGNAGMKSRSYLLKYLRQLAVITPYAQFSLTYVPLELERRKSHGLKVIFKRRSEKMPPLPKVVKHHPKGVGLVKIEELVRLGLEENFKMTLKRFLVTSFEFITSVKARDIVNELGSKFSDDLPLSELSQPMQMHLQNVIKKMTWPHPDGAALSPAGEYNLYLGITKEFTPAMIATAKEPASVFEGHAFIIEAAVSVGGRNMATGLNVHRFANRIPLIFEQSSDLVTHAAQDLPWGAYKINNKEDKIGVFVSLVSTKVPFKGTGKEFVSADCVEIRAAVLRALKQCCNQLKHKISANARERSQRDRKKELLQYVPNVANAVCAVLSNLDATSDRASKRLRLDTDPTLEIPTQKLLERLQESNPVQPAELIGLLKKNVDQYNATETLQFMTQQGKKNQDLRPDNLKIQPKVACANSCSLRTQTGLLLTNVSHSIFPKGVV